ncbi:MAG: CRISPR-associated protein [Nitrospirae bacterium CG08_land_8_20_14_0_20_52_24]|nr:type I CRISPR-associated protein Cas7 [Deltaproteobacteria bacterium]PIS36980.1 MAG: CRISPR-associated protein [Nitrospirae bacterium CG08_land_8_20_14_0_20_52_24]PIV84835.1 MAG: CRISPR-associated protein [Nitrospirae bacterium CG17_big_fil_post_rev_8_21_14_2_50_50_9]PIW86180.1 MAG: CRISPR-associated protein [Nitrospirae bacterium CG_4_8_14_3_um_filter_50_41]PIX86817.1 MAG: CRISPR-associated protein [Nitrospirae bacterium CG_4_10_14_3_um_filter_53_41]
MSNEAKKIMRATGLLVIEAINSNPNGDPDRESDPRQRPDGLGEISPVSFKRKLRDLVEDKEGPVWMELKAKLDLKDKEFDILESRGRNRDEITDLLNNKQEEFKRRYWDGRIFGNTFLEKGAATTIKTGTVQFGMGLSIAPIIIERHTNTNKSGVQEGLDRGMAPMAYRIVQHGIYCMPFFVNPSAAHKSGCTAKDIELLLALIPHAYAHSRSYVRPNVEILNAWYMEHKSAIGSCSDFKLIDSLTPTKREHSDSASNNRKEYDIPSTLPAALQGKVAPLKDLMEF